MGMFDGVEKAKASFDSNYVRRGHYYALINRVKADQTRNGDKFVAIEMTILHTFGDGDGKELQGPEVDLADKWHAPGEDTSQLLMAKQDTFLGNFKAFIANVMGVSDTEIDSKTCEEATDPNNQPMAGKVIELNNRVIKTRAGKDFTKVNYRREVPVAEFANVIDREVLNRYVPDLDARLAEEGDEEA